MESLNFAHPAWLLVGIAAAAAIVFGYRSFDRRRKRDLAKLATASMLDRSATGISRWRLLLKRCCFVGAVLLAFAALARPQVGHEWKELKRRGIDILFALDTSRSMLAEDVAPSRLERAKLGMTGFVTQLGGDRVGLMPFAGSAFLLCPLTLDYNAFQQSLEAVDTEIIPRKGTDLASAIREAERVFDDGGNSHRILVVITDGEDLQGEALAAAEKAAGKGMIVHTVGIGSAGGSLIPIGGDVLKDHQGQPVRSKLDEASLRSISDATGGVYAAFGAGGEGLQQIYREKLALVPQEQLTQRMQKVPLERFQWPLAAAVVLLLIDFLLSERRRGSASASLRPAAAALTFVLLLPVDAKAGAPETYNNGVEAYRANDFDAATQQFNTAIESTSDLGLQARAYYNLGNTLFRQGEAALEDGDAATTKASWLESLEAIEATLALDPDDPDAQHNRDYVKRKLEELEQQQDQQQNDQDQQQEEQQSQDSESKQDESEPGESGDQPQEPEPSDGEGEESKPENESDDGGKSDEPSEDSESESEPSEAGDQPSEGDGQVESDDPKPGEQPKPSEQGEPEGEEGQAPQPADGRPSEGNPDQSAAASLGDERRAEDEMSREEAMQLLKALEGDEEQVLMVPATRGNPRAPDNTTKGKDW